MALIHSGCLHPQELSKASTSNTISVDSRVFTDKFVCRRTNIPTTASIISRYLPYLSYMIQFQETDQLQILLKDEFEDRTVPLRLGLNRTLKELLGGSVG